MMMIVERAEEIRKSVEADPSMRLTLKYYIGAIMDDDWVTADWILEKFGTKFTIKQKECMTVVVEAAIERSMRIMRRTRQLKTMGPLNGSSNPFSPAKGVDKFV